MIPGFKLEDVYDYSQFINSSDKIQNILQNIPNGLSKLEKAYYVYIELGKILNEDPNYVLGSNKDKMEHYNDNIDENYYGVCKSISELYVCVLKDDRVGIEAELTRNRPDDINRSHVDTVLKIDGKNYIANMIGDLTNIKEGRRINNFGINTKQIIKRKRDELVDIFLIQDANLTREEILNLIDNAQEKESYDSIYKLISQYEECEHNMCNELYELIGRFTIISKYIKNINQEYGSVKFLSKSDLEKLDMKLKYSYGKMKSENGKQTRGIYTDDVLHIITKELRDKETAKKYIYDGKEIDESEILDYKLKYICENINKIIEPVNNMTYFDQIMNFKRVADSIISKKEQERMTVYAVKVGKSNRDIIPILKVNPIDSNGNNTYYTYISKNRTYCRVTEEELKEYLKSFESKDLRIIGKFREHSTQLNRLNSRKKIENELEI